MQVVKQYSSTLLGFCFLLLSLSSCANFLTTPQKPSVPSGLSIGDARQLVSTNAPGSGGVISYTKTGDSLSGLTITSGSDAFPSSSAITLSARPITGQTFDSSIRPITPMIEISSSAGSPHSTLQVRIPCHVVNGRFPMAFLYNSSTSELSGLTTTEIAADHITVLLDDLDDNIASSSRSGKGASVQDVVPSSLLFVTDINPALLTNFYDSKFRVLVDNWQFINYGSFVAPLGQCEGQCQSMMWYFQNRKSSGGPLFGKYDDDGGPKTPGFQFDDRLGYRLAGMAQVDMNSIYFFNNQRYQYQKDGTVTDQQIYQTFAYAIRETSLPQLIWIFDAAWGSGHAIIATQTSNGIISLCDPNLPLDAQRSVALQGGKFGSYFSGATGANLGIEYKHFFYMGRNGSFGSTMKSRWAELDAQTIGNGSFPDYTLKILNENDEYVPLNDGDHIKSNVTLLPSSTTSLQLRMFDSDRTEISGDGARFMLPTGKRRIGFNIIDLQNHWVDFKWLNLDIEPGCNNCTTTATVDGATDIFDTTCLVALHDTVIFNFIANGRMRVVAAHTQVFGTGTFTLTGDDPNVLDGVADTEPGDTFKLITGDPAKLFITGNDASTLVGELQATLHEVGGQKTKRFDIKFNCTKQ